MNDFQIINKLGEGAYSVVYKVRRLVDGNIYALKKVKLLNLSEKEKQNALNEVRILASVKSNYVISYKEAFFDENESCLGIVMEYADKGDLYQKISEYKKSAVFFEESEIWRIFIHMVKGLKSLHDLKILHRDLKSANVFLFTDGTAKLGDLNVSKVARRGLGYTQTGTPYYASPEVWKDQPYDNKSDIWSLGCVLYEMITLRPPFRAENMEGLYNKVIKGQISKIPDRFSSDMSEIVKLLLQTSPDLRPSCDQLLKNQIVQKRIEYFKNYAEDFEDQSLLQTIKIPKNLLFLSDKLPQPNYEKLNKKNHSFTKKNANELPDIRSNGKQIKKLKEEELTTSPKKKINKENINQNLKHETEKRENSPLQESIVIDSKNVKHMHINLDPKKQLQNMPMIYELPQVKQKKKLDHDEDYNRRIKEIYEKNSKLIKMNHQYGSDHINNIYKVYAPYLVKNQNKIEKKNKHDKYYDYYNIYKPKKNLDNAKIVPNRRLSPIKNVINL